MVEIVTVIGVMGTGLNVLICKTGSSIAKGLAKHLPIYGHSLQKKAQ